MGGGREKEANGETKSTGASIQNRKPTENGDRNRKPSVEDLVEPPDGGWGWMVVFASFMIHVIADGIVYSFGIFYMEFLDYYKGGKGETAWVGSLVPGVTLSVGEYLSCFTKTPVYTKYINNKSIVSACHILRRFDLSYRTHHPSHPPPSPYRGKVGLTSTLLAYFQCT